MLNSRYQGGLRIPPASYPVGQIQRHKQVHAGFALDDMLKPYISHAQNQLIAQIMYYGKYLETWGCRIELMNEECNLAAVFKLKFEVSGGCFKAIFQRNDYVSDASVAGQQDSGRIQVAPKQKPSSSIIAELVTIMPCGYCTVSQLMEICEEKNRK